MSSVYNSAYPGRSRRRRKKNAIAIGVWEKPLKIFMGGFTFSSLFTFIGFYFIGYCTRNALRINTTESDIADAISKSERIGGLCIAISPRIALITVQIITRELCLCNVAQLPTIPLPHTIVNSIVVE